MKCLKYISVILLIGYIALLVHPFSIPLWIPWTLTFLLFISIFKLKDIPPHFTISGTAFLTQMAGGATSPLFFVYIPLVFLIARGGKKIKPLWLLLPFLSLFRCRVFLPYIIVYGSIFLIYRELLKKKENRKFQDPTTSTDFERSEIRKIISETRSFPKRLSSKFEETLNATVDLIFKLFDPWSAIIFLKDKETGKFSARIGKSKGGLDKNTVISQGPLCWFYKNSGILVNNEYNDSTLNLGYYNSAQFIKCFVASSIEINDRNEGILVVDRRERTPFNERDKEILKSLSENLSTLYSLYRYVDASMLEAFQFQALVNLTGKIAGEIELEEVRSNIFEAINTSFSDVWAIFLLKEGNEYHITEQDGRRYKRPLQNSLIALALQKSISLCKKDLFSETKRAILLPEERDFEARSLMFSPFSGNVEGGILLLSKEVGRFAKKDLIVLNLTSDIAASTIEKAVLYNREREKAILDGLTQVYNHRFFQEILSKKIAETSRNNEPITLVMIDLDNFKMINDSYGHQTGDIVLKEIASLMKERVRSSDILARYGGEEFAIILPSASCESGYKLAEVLRTEIEQYKIKTKDGTFITVTVSSGISECPLHGDNKNDLVAAADRALYIAKKQGKNRTIIGEY